MKEQVTSEKETVAEQGKDRTGTGDRTDRGQDRTGQGTGRTGDRTGQDRKGKETGAHPGAYGTRADAE